MAGRTLTPAGPDGRAALTVGTVHTDCGAAEESPVEVWGLPLAPITMDGTLARIDRMIREGGPGFVITANLNFAMLASSNGRLREAARKAAFVVADGMPLVWAARWKGCPLPQRVAGADLVPALCDMAAGRGYRVLLVGGAPGVAAAAAARLRASVSGLDVGGMEAPSFRRLGERDTATLIDRVRTQRPDLLLLACSQPEGELWLAENCERLRVPACVQIGAAIDFAAGRIPRAPRWLQRLGLEWLYRLFREPRRLGPRYWRNALYACTTRP